SHCYLSTSSFFKGTAPPAFYPLSLHDALPIFRKAGRLATVLVTVHPDCAECSAYLESLRDVQGRVEEWDGRVIAARATEELAAAGVPAPAVLIADQWGELFVVEPAGADHAFIEPDEVVAWLRYLAIQCPECQGEAL